ncbi:hypothetical protein ACCC92_15180 [Mucilaginibacter sp. Mucisp84]|uniref:hypothetical protein n=1 Tax=Mucilaginibacter sp. Mucisp84 TaxID=3243058 RepID=UPI0039A60633
MNAIFHFTAKTGSLVYDKDYQRISIGINNTKQRLEHLYPGKHLSNISSLNNEYIVQLTLQT